MASPTRPARSGNRRRWSGRAARCSPDASGASSARSRRAETIASAPASNVVTAVGSPSAPSAASRRGTVTESVTYVTLWPSSRSARPRTAEPGGPSVSGRPVAHREARRHQGVLPARQRSRRRGGAALHEEAPDAAAAGVEREEVVDHRRRTALALPRAAPAPQSSGCGIEKIMVWALSLSGSKITKRPSGRRWSRDRPASRRRRACPTPGSPSGGRRSTAWARASRSVRSTACSPRA